MNRRRIKGRPDKTSKKGEEEGAGVEEGIDSRVGYIGPGNTEDLLYT